MRKNLIAMSVAAFVGGLGMAGGAAAGVVQDISVVSPTNADTETVRGTGAGHQLIVPYYNTQNGNATLFNITNTDVTNGKAVKVRFRGGSNSDDVFDFQVYLSPGDVWGATISRSASGVSKLATVDKSCTLPAGVGSGGGSDFVTARLPQTLTGDALATQTREGYIEMFNMADIPPFLPDAATGAATATVNPLFTAIKHVAGVAPCTPATLNTLAADVTVSSEAYTRGFRSPSASLFSNWTIVNVPKSGSSTGEAIALTATLAGAPARGNIVFFPQTGAAAATPDLHTADPSLRTVAGAAPGQVSDGNGNPFTGATPIIVASQFDLPDLSTPYLLLGAYPPVATDPITFATNLTAALSTQSVTNEYLTDTTIGAFTDWVFSQPTRRYNVAPDYRPLSASPPTAVLRAFNDVSTTYYSATSTAVSGFQICANTAGVTYYDREEFTAVGNNFVISPNPPAAGFRLCGETSVLTFNSAGPSVLGAEIARTNFATGSVRDGWATVATPGAGALGLPIVGKAFSAASTGSLNVGGSWEHRYVK